MKKVSQNQEKQNQITAPKVFNLVSDVSSQPIPNNT